jgi:hypothetical protein
MKRDEDERKARKLADTEPTRSPEVENLEPRHPAKPPSTR